ncbi:MAG: mechanosensitive ion channel family protein [Magnetococcales bacterium]|nr:mechanosensitive ion channel family protein [Magnetococcales bacterium]
MRIELRWILHTLTLLVTLAVAHLFPPENIQKVLALPTSLTDWLIDGLFVIWWYGLAWAIVTGTELFCWRKWYGVGKEGGEGVPRPRVLWTELFDIGVFLVVTGVVVVQVLHQPITTVFATSGMMAIILGLALQNTLVDLFAGLALNIERPFRAGDWITLDDKTQGMVTVTNWRSTHIRLRTLDVLILPNSLIARSRVINHAIPNHIHREQIDIPLLYGFDVDPMRALLLAATKQVADVLETPLPFVLLHEMRPAVVIWRVYFFMDDFPRLGTVRGLVTASILKALQGDEWRQWLPTQSLCLYTEGTPRNMP